MSAAHGLVIGKFYPPHAGHHLLVHAAASACDRLTVVVMAASVESIPLAVRVGWMREVHADEPNVTVTGIVDDVEIDLHSDAVWQAHVDLMRRAARGVSDAPVDAVFTSEGYGAELGRRLGARHVAIDPDRTLVPVSATAVRADPIGQWHQLAPCVKAGLARRVVLVGAESTGKTTLARALAERLAGRGDAWADTRWVPEYGRDYTIRAVARARVVFVERPGGQAQFSAALKVGAPSGPAGDRALDDRIRELVVAVVNEPGAALDVPSLARRLGMSPRHFARVFRDRTGETPAAFVARARVEAAQRALADTGASLATIAADCGFGTEATLRRTFARVLGVSPSAWRARFSPAGARSDQNRSVTSRSTR
ncbi:MAG: helix-turn-helix domain-containing protein [Myxococcota bacterium]